MKEKIESNIDKDIHMLKSYAGMTHKLTDNQGRPKLDQAIDNVLVDRETWKKIAEKLAEELVEVMKSQAEESNVNLKEYFKDEIDVKETIIDWARKEVENERKNT